MQRSGEEVEVRNNRILGFVLIDFEGQSFKFVQLISKKHALVTCNKILLNITVKITQCAKCDKYNSLGCKICSQIV